MDGLPTLDVGDPYDLPDTSEGALREAEDEDADAAVSVEQAFNFLGFLAESSADSV